MKRLTEWIGTAVSLCCESCLGMPQNCDCEDCQREATNRLFAIENILGDEYDLDKLRELVQVNKEQVERMRSCWITVTEVNGKQYSKCAACQTELDCLEDAYMFCPYCGARMDKEDEIYD